MRDFKKSGGGYRGGFGGRDGGRDRGFGGRRDRGPVTMHEAVCDQCGQPCEVPFRPTDGKPVYCNACFGGKKETGNDRGRGESPRFPQKNYDRYRAPARPDFGRDSGKGNNDETRKQLEILNIKMDRLIKAVEAIASARSSAAEVPAVKAKKVSKK